MKAIIWTLPNCPNCEAEKTILAAEGYEVEERDGDKIAADPMRLDVMAQLSIQNGAYPVVCAEGKFRKPWKLAKSGKENDGWQN